MLTPHNNPRSLRRTFNSHGLDMNSPLQKESPLQIFSVDFLNMQGSRFGLDMSMV